MRSILFVISLIVVGNLGCGVRGAPVPPGSPAELGYGSPRYKDAKNRVSPDAVPGLKELDQEDQKEKEDDDK